MNKFLSKYNLLIFSIIMLCFVSSCAHQDGAYTGKYTYNNTAFNINKKFSNNTEDFSILEYHKDKKEKAAQYQLNEDCLVDVYARNKYNRN